MTLTLYPEQADFVGASVPHALFSGGYGAGKTHALIVRALRLCAEYPHVAHGVAGPTFKALRKDILGPMRSMLREMGVEFAEHRTDFHLKPGWCVGADAGLWFVGTDSPDSLKGPNWGTVSINEPGIISREAYDVLLSRARVPLLDCADCGVSRLESVGDLGITRPKPGESYSVDAGCPECGAREVEVAPNYISMAGTPEGFNWLYDEWIDRARHPSRDWSQWQVWTVDTRRNPFLPESYAERLLESYDEQLAREKVGGGFVNVRQGAIYYAFDRGIHLDESLELDPDAPILWGLDFNVEPLCSVVMQQRGRGLVVLDEVVSPTGGRTAELVEEFARRYGHHRAGVEVLGDRSGYSRDTRGGTRTDYAVLEESARAHGLERLEVLAARRNPPRLERYALVNGMLRPTVGAPRLHVHASKCWRLVRDLEQQGYKRGTLLADEGPNRELGHCADALGYVCIARHALDVSRGRVALPIGG